MSMNSTDGRRSLAANRAFAEAHLSVEPRFQRLRQHHIADFVVCEIAPAIIISQPVTNNDLVPAI
jgi:hypothetical protein